MSQRLIQEIGKSQRLRIVNCLKRTRGLSVREIAARLGMSYMGVKGQCLLLERGRYLDTWRRPKAVGRPELVYRLTRRAHELFPVASNAMTLALLRAAGELYGANAAEKLLFRVFRGMAEAYRGRVRGSAVAERAKWLARLRDAEGYFAEVEEGEGGRLALVEHHSPILDLLGEYPAAARMEEQMIGAVLGVRVERVDESAGGLYCCRFRVGG